VTMRTLRIFRRAALSCVTVAIALGGSAGPVQAGPAGGALPADGAAAAGQTTVAAITDRLARRLASDLAADARRAGLFTAAATGPVDLAGLAASPALSEAVQAANRAVLAAKGLAGAPTGTSLLQLRLAHPDMLAALRAGLPPLVAAAPTDDTATAVAGYDSAGATVLLDVARIPQRPVFVVEVDTERALPLGLAVIRATLDAHGVHAAAPAVAPAAGYWATKVTAVRLRDDHEPWIKGAAEIFGIAGGFGLDGKAKASTLTMPYLDHDNTTYYPNQLIVHFSAYKYNLADFVMMEDDGDTNYQALAIAITNALLTIVDGGAYIPLVNAILNAIPASWWTDDPDYVDSWYTLATTSSGRLNGAAANGWMDVVPYWVQEF